MKNRAKCKLCKEIIESFHQHDFVSCKCGEISIDGGLDYLHSRANDYINFLRVDDEGNEIIVTFTEKKHDNSENKTPKEPDKKVAKEDLLEILDSMIKSDDELPEHAKSTFVTQYDLLRYMLIISNILKRG